MPIKKSYFKNRVAVTCQNCGVVYHSGQRGKKGLESKYCSRKCAGESKKGIREPVHRICEECGDSFVVPAYTAKYNASRFCSTKCSHKYRIAGLADRFWSKVVKTDKCWLWSGGVNQDGYGRLMIMKPHGLSYISAHRASWIINCGPIGDNEKILHHCDNPPCVRPNHLFKGTQADNVADMVAKGRRRVHKTLSRSQVLEIRSLWDRGVDPNIIAKQFKVTRPTIRQTGLRRIHKDII